ncbi:MAG: response regulator, partial [Elusimicrobiota bacterium]|nr:response regulator [Elusimicrobiota bacterium]
SVGYTMLTVLFILSVAVYIVIDRREKGRDEPEDEKTCAEGQPARSEISPIAENKPKILQIDDNLENMKGVKALFERAFPGASVFMAAGGAEGIALALAEAPDLILLNILMPEMDGLEVCRRLKADDRLKAIPVLFMTTDKTDKESRAKALEAGGYGFLRKPVEMEKLAEQVRAISKLKEKKRQEGDAGNAADTSGNWKTYFNPYIIILASVFPIVVSLLAGSIAGLFGETLNADYAPNIPVIGGLLHAMGGFGLAGVVTIPAGAAALLAYYVLRLTGRLKK